MGFYNALSQTTPNPSIQAAVEPNHSQQRNTSQDKVMVTPEYPNQVSNKIHSQAKEGRRTKKKLKKRHSKDGFSEAYFQGRDCTFKPRYLTLLLLTTTSAEQPNIPLRRYI